MRPNFYVLQYFHHKLATLVVPPTNGTATLFSALQSASGPLTKTVNSIQIDA